MSIVYWNIPTPTPNQKLEDIVFTCGSSVVVNAPAAEVFGVITAFSRYAEWNTWTHAAEFGVPDENVQVGSKGVLKTYMKEQKREFDVPIEIIRLDRDVKEYAVAWRASMLPAWAHRAERVQVVTPLTAETCEVKQWESMSRTMAYFLKHVMRIPKQLRAANENYLEELTRRAVPGQPS